MKYLVVFLTLCFTLITFASDKNKTITLNVGGMHCQNCADKVEGALHKVKGVKEAKVELEKKKAIIVLASAVTTTSLIDAVSSAGFTASEGELPAKSEMKKKSKIAGEDCEEGCCDGEHNSKKTKKTDTKGS